MAGNLIAVPDQSRAAAICDANVLIDYVKADEDIIRELVGYWGKVFVPDLVLSEVKQLPPKRAEELGLAIVETPLTLPQGAGLSVPDRACLHTSYLSAGGHALRMIAA